MTQVNFTCRILEMLPLILFPGAGSELYWGLGSAIVGGLIVFPLSSPCFWFPRSFRYGNTGIPIDLKAPKSHARGGCRTTAQALTRSVHTVKDVVLYPTVRYDFNKLGLSRKTRDIGNKDSGKSPCRNGAQVWVGF